MTGEERWLTCTYSPMPEGGYVVVARDVTAQKQVDDLKADFLATVSHELRTPLTPIQGFLQTLLSEVELVCDRVVIISRGRVVAAGTSAELARHGGVEVETADGVRAFKGVPDIFLHAQEIIQVADDPVSGQAGPRNRAAVGACVA